MTKIQPRLQIRVVLGDIDRLGPGKVSLLENLERTGSISAAGRAMNMSYRRAWLLIDTLNHVFKKPVVVTSIGGERGGGAALTPFGREIIALYRSMERTAAAALSSHMKTLSANLVATKPKDAPKKSVTGRRPPAKWG